MLKVNDTPRKSPALYHFSCRLVVFVIIICRWLVDTSHEEWYKVANFYGEYYYKNSDIEVRTWLLW